MISLVYIFFSFLFFTLASSLFYLFGIDTFRPDLLTIICFVIIRTRPSFYALITSLIIALMFASFHQTDSNIFVLQVLILFSSMKLFVGRYLNLEHPLFIALFLICAELVLQTLLWGTIGVLQKGNWVQTPPLFGSIFPIALATGLFANPVMFFFKWLLSLSPFTGNDDIYLLKRG